MTRRALRICCGAAALAGAFAAGPAPAEMVRLPFGNIASLPVKSIVELRFNNMVRQRFDLSCGAAAVATLLTYFYGDKIDERDVIVGAIKVGDKEKIEKEGFSMLELKRYGESKGYVVQGLKITKPEAIGEINIPFLTLISSRGYNHFVIVKGTKDGIVYYADPAFGNRSMPADLFIAGWSKVILVYLSRTKKPNNQFALEAGIRAPTSQVVQIVDRYLTRIRPGANEF
jgi:hypothetical protein